MNTVTLTYTDLLLLVLLYDWCVVRRNDCAAYHKLLNLMNETIGEHSIPVRLATQQKATHVVMGFAKKMEQLGWIDPMKPPIVPRDGLVQAAEEALQECQTNFLKLPLFVPATKKGIDWANAQSA